MMEVTNALFEGGIHSNIYRLKDACVSGRDEIDIATQIIHPIDKI
jgi:hypothetical protein